MVDRKYFSFTCMCSEVEGWLGLLADPEPFLEQLYLKREWI
jgi:hypothetical protein